MVRQLAPKCQHQLRSMLRSRTSKDNHLQCDVVFIFLPCGMLILRWSSTEWRLIFQRFSQLFSEILTPIPVKKCSMLSKNTLEISWGASGELKNHIVITLIYYVNSITCGVGHYPHSIQKHHGLALTGWKYLNMFEEASNKYLSVSPNSREAMNHLQFTYHW